MKISYEGIGQWAATFACAGVSAGQVVKISENGTVSTCAAGDDVAGVVLAVSRDETACSVVLGGLVTVAYTGETMPNVGWCTMSADGKGGMAVNAGGRKYLVVCVDKAANTITFAM